MSLDCIFALACQRNLDPKDATAAATEAAARINAQLSRKKAPRHVDVPPIRAVWSYLPSLVRVRRQSSSKTLTLFSQTNSPRGSCSVASGLLSVWDWTCQVMPISLRQPKTTVPWTATSLDTRHAAFTTTSRIIGGIGRRATRSSRQQGAGLARARNPESNFERLGIDQLCFFVRRSDFFKDRLQQSDCRRTRDVVISSSSQRDRYRIGLW